MFSRRTNLLWALGTVLVLAIGCGQAKAPKKKAKKPTGPRAATAFEKLKATGAYEGYEVIQDAEAGLDAYVSGFRKKDPRGGVHITVYHRGTLAQGRVSQVSADFVGVDIPSEDVLRKTLENVFRACGYEMGKAAALAKELWDAAPVKTKGASATRELNRDGHYGFVIDARGSTQNYVKMSAMPKGMAPQK